MTKISAVIFAAALLLVGCAMPAPLVPQPPGPGPVATVTATPNSKAHKAAAGTIQETATSDETCAITGWTMGETLGAILAAVLFIAALVGLYRRKRD
jgi:hypothetical protein